MAGVKRHRMILRENIQGITKPVSPCPVIVLLFLKWLLHRLFAVSLVVAV
jgi:hypothetical protein